MLKRLAYLSALLIGGVVVLAVGLRLVILHTKPYEIARAFVAKNSKIVAEVGSPSTAKLSYYPQFSAKYGAISGSAEMMLVAKGPNGWADVYIELTKNLGVWHVARAVLVTPKGARIVLK